MIEVIRITFILYKNFKHHHRRSRRQTVYVYILIMYDLVLLALIFKNYDLIRIAVIKSYGLP